VIRPRPGSGPSRVRNQRRSRYQPDTHRPVLNCRDVDDVLTAVPKAEIVHGMAAKAPSLAELEETRKAATLLATAASGDDLVDDVDLLDLLMSSRRLPRAQRAEQENCGPGCGAEPALWPPPSDRTRTHGHL
jgi:hypothetical protein